MINPIDNTQPPTDTSSRTPTTSVTPESSGSNSRSNSGITGSEQVNVSGRGHMAGALNKAAHDSNGVDQARVQAIRNQMANGSSPVSARDIASAMIKAHGA